MKVNDLISGLIVLGVSLFAFFYAGTFVSMPGVPYGPGMFPKIIAVIMGGSSLILIVSGVRNLETQPLLVLQDWAYRPRSYAIFFGIIFGVIFYIQFADALGFMLTSTLLLFTILTIARGLDAIVSGAVIAIISSSLIFASFAYALRVPLPYGIIENFVLGYGQ